VKLKRFIAASWIDMQRNRLLASLTAVSNLNYKSAHELLTRDRTNKRRIKWQDAGARCT